MAHFLFRKNMSFARQMNKEKVNLQKRDQLMKEFKLGLISKKEYRRAVDKLDGKAHRRRAVSEEPRASSPMDIADDDDDEGDNEEDEDEEEEVYDDWPSTR